MNKVTYLEDQGIIEITDGITRDGLHIECVEFNVSELDSLIHELTVIHQELNLAKESTNENR